MICVSLGSFISASIEGRPFVSLPARPAVDGGYTEHRPLFGRLIAFLGGFSWTFGRVGRPATTHATGSDSQVEGRDPPGPPGPVPVRQGRRRGGTRPHRALLLPGEQLPGPAREHAGDDRGPLRGQDDEGRRGRADVAGRVDRAHPVHAR